LAFDVAVLIQAAAECGYQMRALIGRSRAEEPDHRHSWLLRARREGQCRRRAAEQRDEIAPFHAPIRRTRSNCCAIAASGHPAAAPPISVMNSRRPMKAVT
jgi:hypothetical protein